MPLQEEQRDGEQTRAGDEHHQVEQHRLGDTHGAKAQGVLQDELQGQQGGAAGHQTPCFIGYRIPRFPLGKQKNQCQCEQRHQYYGTKLHLFH